MRQFGCVVALIPLLLACGQTPEPEATAGGAAAGGASHGGGNSQTGGSGAGTPPEPETTPKSGIPGCGFELAAFCDAFDVPSLSLDRAGELDRVYWSAARNQPHFATANSRAFPVGMALFPDCRPDVATEIFPSGDARICDPTASIASNHLVVGVAAQNYGINSYRVRQPFDFAGRAGTIVFDAEVHPLHPLVGWISVAVTEDPVGAPSYAILDNNEGGVIPKNAFEVHFLERTGGGALVIAGLHVFRDHADTVYLPDEFEHGAAIAPGKLNHFEIEVSEQRIEVRVSPWSEDGTSFATPELVYAQDVELSFSRGYVQLSVFNHAALKYSLDYIGELVDAPIAHFDNVGFDGPVMNHWREHEIPDALRPFEDAAGADPYNLEQRYFELGYFINDESAAPEDVLTFHDVEVDDVARAQLALSVFYNRFGESPLEDYTLLYRLNGGSWRERPLSAADVEVATAPRVLDASGAPHGAPGTQGVLGHVIELEVGDLVTGDNTLELLARNVPQNYPPAAINVDLVLTTR
jgi:hypothetical protein